MSWPLNFRMMSPTSQAAFLGRAARLDERDLGTLRAAQAQLGDVARDFADLHADAPARDLAGLLIWSATRTLVDRHRERNALVAAGAGQSAN